MGFHSASSSTSALSSGNTFEDVGGFGCELEFGAILGIDDGNEFDGAFDHEHKHGDVVECDDVGEWNVAIDIYGEHVGRRRWRRRRIEHEQQRRAADAGAAERVRALCADQREHSRSITWGSSLL